MDIEHVHEWMRPVGPHLVVDTNPPQYPYVCACGAFTHDPETGKPCRTCNPVDYANRSDDLVRLRGGPLDGKYVVRPLNKKVNFRAEDEGRAQKFLIYKPADEDPDVWDFWAYDWTVPFGERSPLLAGRLPN